MLVDTDESFLCSSSGGLVDAVDSLGLRFCVPRGSLLVFAALSCSLNFNFLCILESHLVWLLLRNAQ